MRCAALEQELCKSRRREEKQQALQYRLLEDMGAAGGDLAVFDQLNDVRAMNTRWTMLLVAPQKRRQC